MNTSQMTRRGTSAPVYNRDPFTSFFERFFTDPYRMDSRSWTEDLSNRTWMPPVDIRETEEAFLVTAELAGLSKDDINITLEDNVLTLSGERRFEKEADKDNYHRIERAYGSFSRSFTLGSGVTSENVKAAFKDGVLTVTVPKREESKPRKIDIR